MNRDSRRRLRLVPETLRILRGHELCRAHAGINPVITFQTMAECDDIVTTSVKCKSPNETLTVVPHDPAARP